MKARDEAASALLPLDSNNEPGEAAHHPSHPLSALCFMRHFCSAGMGTSSGRPRRTRRDSKELSESQRRLGRLRVGRDGTGTRNVLMK